MRKHNRHRHRIDFDLRKSIEREASEKERLALEAAMTARAARGKAHWFVQGSEKTAASETHVVWRRTQRHMDRVGKLPKSLRCPGCDRKVIRSKSWVVRRRMIAVCRACDRARSSAEASSVRFAVDGVGSKAERVTHRCSVRQMAALLGVGPSTVVRFERGDPRVTKVTAADYARVLREWAARLEAQRDRSGNERKRVDWDALKR